MGYNCGTHYGTRQWINLDICGLFCGCMTYVLLLFGMVATSRSVIIPWLGFTVHGCFHLILFNAMSIMGGYCHFLAMTTDPGSVPKDAKPLPDDAQENDYESAENKTDRYKKYCKRCKAFKPARAHHCSLCGRCIVKMDHHCPWVNNCVGIGNHKLFLLFLFWVFSTCVYAMVLVAAKYIVCISGHGSGCNSEVDEHLVVIFLMVESVLFGLFTLCMLGDQLSAIMSNQTQIDRLKNTKIKQQTEVNEVFGSPSHIMCATHWLYPVPVDFVSVDDSIPSAASSRSSDIRSTIMGYVLDETPEDELVPLMRAANASFTSSSPLHPDYNPATAAAQKKSFGGNGNSGDTSGSSGGALKGGTISMLNRKRNIRGVAPLSQQQNMMDTDSLRSHSDDSYYGGGADGEGITEWLTSSASEPSATGTVSVIEMSKLSTVNESAHENSVNSETDDVSVPLLSPSAPPSSGDSPSAVRKRI